MTVLSSFSCCPGLQSPVDNRLTRRKKKRKGRDRELPRELNVGRSHTDSRIKLWIHTASLKTSNIPFAWFLVLGCNRQAQRLWKHLPGDPNIGLHLHQPQARDKLLKDKLNALLLVSRGCGQECLWLWNLWTINDEETRRWERTKRSWIKGSYRWTTDRFIN